MSWPRLRQQPGAGSTIRGTLHLEDRRNRTLEEQWALRWRSSRSDLGVGAERLSRLRLNPALTGSAELTRLLETEVLSLGIEGKLAMWLALKEVAVVTSGWPGPTSTG